MSKSTKRNEKNDSFHVLSATSTLLERSVNENTLATTLFRLKGSPAFQKATVSLCVRRMTARNDWLSAMKLLSFIGTKTHYESGKKVSSIVASPIVDPVLWGLLTQSCPSVWSRALCRYWMAQMNPYR